MKPTREADYKIDAPIPTQIASCQTCSLFDPDVLTAAIHLQQLKRERFGGGHVEIHFTPDGAINTNAIYDVSRRKRA